MEKQQTNEEATSERRSARLRRLEEKHDGGGIDKRKSKIKKVIGLLLERRTTYLCHLIRLGYLRVIANYGIRIGH